MLKIKILYFLFINTSLLAILRFLIQEGITKQFLELVIGACFIVFASILFFSLVKDRKPIAHSVLAIKNLYQSHKLITFSYFVILSSSIVFLQFRIESNNISELVLLSAVFLFFVGLYLIAIFKTENTQEALNINKNNMNKALILSIISLIPIFRYCVSNKEILFRNEMVYLVFYFALTSFLVIIFYSFIFDSILGISIFQVFNTSLLIFIFEMPTISYTYSWVKPNNVNILLGIFLIIFIFAYLIFNSTLRQLTLFSVMIFFISVIPNLTTEGEDIELANINMNSVFTNSDYQSLKTTPSIVLLVYDGYPQLETLENMNIDNSEHINFLLDQKFTIYNGIYSHGSYTLATMSGLFQGETDTYGEKNGRLITGGYSSFINLLNDNEYFTAGIFTSSFYLPPTAAPNYDYYYPVSANRSSNIYKSMLRGKQTFKDLIYASPHINYLEQKRNFLGQIHEYDDPVFLYSHTYYPGHTQNSGQCLDGEFEDWKEDLKKGNMEMREDVNSLKESFENSIIILIGDHGPFLTKNCTSLHDYPPDEINRQDIQDRHGTFVAIRTPDLKQIDFDKRILQNLFIYVHSYLNNDLSILDKINTENINNSHLPSSINVIDNEIIGGIDDGQVLFKNRENLSK